MVKEISIGQLPSAVKKLAMVFADVVKIYACDTIVELINTSKSTSLEMMIIAQTKNDKPEKHFLVGLAMPCKTDDFTTPLLYFSPLTYEQYIKYEEVIKDKLKVKDINRKSNIWMPRK